MSAAKGQLNVNSSWRVYHAKIGLAMRIDQKQKCVERLHTVIAFTSAGTE